MMRFSRLGLPGLHLSLERVRLLVICRNHFIFSCLHLCFHEYIHLFLEQLLSHGYLLPTFAISPSLARGRAGPTVVLVAAKAPVRTHIMLRCVLVSGVGGDHLGGTAAGT